MLGDSVTRPSFIANSQISRPVSPHCLSFAVTASIAISFSQFARTVLLPRCTLLSAIFLSPFYQSLVPFSRGSSFFLSSFSSLFFFSFSYADLLVKCSTLAKITSGQVDFTEFSFSRYRFFRRSFSGPRRCLEYTYTVSGDSPL